MVWRYRLLVFMVDLYDECECSLKIVLALRV